MTTVVNAPYPKQSQISQSDSLEVETLNPSTATHLNCEIDQL